MTIGRKGEIALPQSLRERYGLTPETTVWAIDTGTGVLLVPITDDPMDEQLAAELTRWQAVGTASLEAFPYGDDAE